MNDSLRSLYQEVIFDHNRNPRNFGELERCNRHADGYNPLCGDQLKVYLVVDDDDVIEEIRFKGRGCAISTASASIMTETLKGKSVAEAERYFASFHAMVTDSDAPDDAIEDLDKLEVLSGVKSYPSRVKCATLAWHTVRAAIHGDKAATTE